MPLPMGPTASACARPAAGKLPPDRDRPRGDSSDFPSSQLLCLRPSSAYVSLSLKHIFYFHPSLTNGGNRDRQVIHLRTHVSVKLGI